MESKMVSSEKEWLECCGSMKFAQNMASAGPFSNFQQALDAAKDIWFNKVDVNGWLEAIAANPQIGETHSQQSNGEQSTATESALQEIREWNARYRDKFGFAFLMFGPGRSTQEILEEMKRRYENRPIVELEVAAGEQMKIAELHLAKLFNKINASAPKHILTKSGSFVPDRFADMSHNPNSPPVGYVTGPAFGGGARAISYSRQDSYGRNPNSPMVGHSHDNID